MLAAAVAACLLLATALAAVVTARQLDRREATLLDARARRVAATIDRRSENYIEKLYGVRALFEVEGRPTPRAFDRFLGGQRIFERFPGISAIAHAQLITAAQAPRFAAETDRALRASGLPYRLPFRIAPNAQRSRMAPLDYVFPVRAHAAAAGFDVLSESLRRAAVERTLTTGRPAATAPVALRTERRGAQAVVVLLVVRGAGGRPDGLVSVSIRMPDLLRGVVAPGDDLEIYDVGEVGSVERRLRRDDVAYDANGRPEALDPDSDGSRTLALTTAGRRWKVYVRPAGRLLSAGERAIPWLVAGLGALISALGYAVVRSVATGRARAQRLADAMTVDLKRSNEELERFAFLASHDLQQPLRTISGFLQLLQRRAGARLDAESDGYIRHALRGTRQMARLIDDLLTYSRIAHDDRPLVPVALDDAWDAAVTQLRAAIEDAGARVSRGPLPVVQGDASQLEQVFANLIVNAVKYRAEAAPEIRAAANRVDGAWEVGVADNGIGIDPRHHARIFEMFRRLHSDDEVEGTGVGLALAKRIVERSGGDIRVESEPGRGSRFVVVLPVTGAEPRRTG